jgi:hypothetical protein
VGRLSAIASCEGSVNNPACIRSKGYLANAPYYPDLTRRYFASYARMIGGDLGASYRVEPQQPTLNLKKANEDSSKTIEELAFNQLDVTTQIKNLLSTGEVAAKFAKATTPTLSKFYGLVADSKLEIAKAADNIFGSTEDMRTAMGDLSKPVEGIIKGKVTGDDNMMKTEIGNLETNVDKKDLDKLMHSLYNESLSMELDEC